MDTVNGKGFNTPTPSEGSHLHVEKWNTFEEELSWEHSNYSFQYINAEIERNMVGGLTTRIPVYKCRNRRDRWFDNKNTSSSQSSEESVL